MIKTSGASVLTFAERCKNILCSNWHGQLHTIKADSKGSKESIHSSRMWYLLKKGKPYVWVPEDDLHNLNTMIDERGGLSVVHTIPGPLSSLLRCNRKLPPRVALIGDIIHLKEEKVKSTLQIIKEDMLSEQNAVKQASYSVSGILSSSSLSTRLRSESLMNILEAADMHTIFRFNVRSCTYIDDKGGNHELDFNDVVASEMDPLAPFAEKLIDGINQVQMRRRALILFSLVHLNANIRDAYMLSVDRKGFDILGKMPVTLTKDGQNQYEWKELRLSFKEDARDIEEFCHMLVKMEENTLEDVAQFSGIG